MGKYYVNGYATPEGISNSADVKRIQAALGVKQDGIWGPQTQSAWNAQNQGGDPGSKSIPTTAPTVSRPDYAISGFTPPEGVTDRQKVRSGIMNAIMQTLGVYGVRLNPV